jgi:hypothetical protein
VFARIEGECGQDFNRLIGKGVDLVAFGEETEVDSKVSCIDLRVLGMTRVEPLGMQCHSTRIAETQQRRWE